MNNYKVCVYAISKNEAKFVNRWVKSMQEADKIIVLDTGSSDNTIKLLEENGVEVHQKIINPWRFDIARNESLKLIPKDYDVCVCTDLDEVFEKGWKEELLKVWNNNVTRVRYKYNWSFDEYGNPATTFMINKIHKNNMYTWINPVHEVLQTDAKEKEIMCEKIVLNHYPDRLKSRSNYLNLLELSVEENPFDDRNMHYLGREYMYYGRWQECIATLKKHLKLKNATWKDERSASMRFIARSYKALNKNNNAIKWYKKAIQESPMLREAYVELAFLYYEKRRYNDAYIYLKKALEIDKKSISYINEEFAWNSFIYDLLSIIAYNLGLYKESYLNAKKALEMDKNNLRLQYNLEEIEKLVN